MSEGPVEGVRNALALLENAYWMLQVENERLQNRVAQLEAAYGLLDNARADDNGMALGPEMGFD